MIVSRAFQFAGVALLVMALAGCPGNGTHRASAAHARPDSVAGADGVSDLMSIPTRPAVKNAPREAFLSTYSNPEEGISFRYPRYYALEEGDLEEHSYFMNTQGDLDVAQPGSRLVATLLIPEDGYPNTTFVHGSLQFIVNDLGTREGCEQGPGQSEGASTLARDLTARGMVFRVSERKYEIGGTEVLEREYASYSGGACYEFNLVVAVESEAAPDGINKPADEGRIMRQLEKIVGSAQLQEKQAAPVEELNANNSPRL